MSGNLVGYVRVSKVDQNPDMQLDEMHRLGVVKIFQDKASGAKDRPQWNACLEYLQPGNVLVVWKIDRLGRTMTELVRIVNELQERGIEFRSITESFIDTTTIHGKLIFHIFAALAEHERATIIERTNAGLAAARERGRFGGRPSTMTKAKTEQAARMRSEGMSLVQIADVLGVGRMAVSRALTARQQATESVQLTAQG